MFQEIQKEQFDKLASGAKKTASGELRMGAGFYDEFTAIDSNGNVQFLRQELYCTFPDVYYIFVASK